MEFRGDVLSLAAPGDIGWCSRGHGGTLLLSSWAGQLTRDMVTSTPITKSTTATTITTEDRASTTPTLNLIMGLLKAT